MSGSKRQRLWKGLKKAKSKVTRSAATPAVSGPVKVTFVGACTGEVEAGTTVLKAAKDLGVSLSHYCGGHCTCGTCRIELVEGAQNLSEPRGNEQMVLGVACLKTGSRLACQARILGPVQIRIPSWF